MQRPREIPLSPLLLPESFLRNSDFCFIPPLSLDNVWNSNERLRISCSRYQPYYNNYARATRADEHGWLEASTPGHQSSTGEGGARHQSVPSNLPWQQSGYKLDGDIDFGIFRWGHTFYCVHDCNWTVENSRARRSKWRALSVYIVPLKKGLVTEKKYQKRWLHSRGISAKELPLLLQHFIPLRSMWYNLSSNRPASSWPHSMLYISSVSWRRVIIRLDSRFLIFWGEEVSRKREITQRPFHVGNS